MAAEPTEDGVKIPLYSREGFVREYAIVDAADAAWVERFKWNAHYAKGACRARRGEWNGKRTQQFWMAREVMGIPPRDPREVDHINGDKLDNRRCNLRVVSHAENIQNYPAIGGSSRFRGVSWHKRTRRWYANASIRNKLHFIGSFEDEVEAARAAQAFRDAHMPYAQPDPELAKLEEVVSG